MTATGPKRQTYWDWRAAGNFIGGGTGTGLMLAAALTTLFGPERPLSVLLALVFVGAGLFLVWLEIGRPLRFLNVFRQPGRSWMTREAYASLPYFAAGAAAWWFSGPWLAIAAALFGLFFLFCQGNILVASKGIPTWREPAMLPLIMATGAAEGFGLFTILTAAGDVVPPWAAFFLFNLILLRIIAWIAYRTRTAGRLPTASRRVLDRLHGPFLLLGNLFPMAILAAGLIVPSHASLLAATAGLLALIGGWALKFVIVTRAAHTQGFAIVRSPARGRRGSGGPGSKPGW